MLRTLNPKTFVWEGPYADYTPLSDDLPWCLIATMADASYKNSLFHIERYQGHVMAKSHELIAKYDNRLENVTDPKERMEIKKEANEAVAQMAKEESLNTLEKVLSELTNQMKNAYSRSDA